MTRILIRCDASKSIGSGHVFRCRTLARELQSRGAEVIFICRRQPNDLIDLLEQEFSVLSLPSINLISVFDPYGVLLFGRDLYAAWLGCDEEEDACQVLQLLRQSGIDFCDWLVVDHYGLDVTWEQQVLKGLSNENKRRTQLFVIDDLADRFHAADLLLDPNFFGDKTLGRYKGLLPLASRQLLGPHYALLGPEYGQLHPLMPIRTEINRVFVFFGGVDAHNCASKVLEAISLPVFDHLEVDIVLGRQSSDLNQVKSLVLQRPHTNLHFSLPSLAGLMARADLAIGAGGSTTWERACLGLPSLVVTIADNQGPFAKAMHEAGYIELLGSASEVTVHDLENVLQSRIQNPSMSSAGHQLTDGLGVQRVVTSMLGFAGEIRLREIQAFDQSMLTNWSQYSNWTGDPNLFEKVSSGSGIYSLIKPTDNTNCIQRIAIDANGCAFGWIRLDREVITQKVVVDLYLDRAVESKDAEAILACKALGLMEHIWPQSLNQACYLSASNIKSLFGSSIDFTCDSLALSPSRITLLSDAGSWLNDHLYTLVYELWRRGHVLRWIHQPTELARGEVCFLLGCGRLLSSEQLALHDHNLVVHESALPKGQGWSPMTWQILEGAGNIPVTLFEAKAQLDAGPIYLQDNIQLSGTELIEEWRSLQASATINLCLNWIDHHKEYVLSTQPQRGGSSHYQRRRPIDSALDPQRSLAEQFNLLRVVDNDRYPAFMDWQGRRYELTIQAGSIEQT